MPVEPIQVKKKQRKAAPAPSPVPAPIKVETPKPQRQRRKKVIKIFSRQKFTMFQEPETPKTKTVKAEPAAAMAMPISPRNVETKPLFNSPSMPAKPAIFEEEEEEVVEEESGTVFVPQNYNSSNNGMSINKLLS